MRDLWGNHVEPMPARRKGNADTASGYERQADDFYRTFPENTRACLLHLTLRGRVWEPACGQGHITKELERQGHLTFSSDLIDRGFSPYIEDFLAVQSLEEIEERYNISGIQTIFTNPPNNLSELFVRKALELLEPRAGMCAFFMPIAWGSASGRIDLFERASFHLRISPTWRPVWFPKKERPDGPDANPKMNYDWWIWDWSYNGVNQWRVQGKDECLKS